MATEEVIYNPLTFNNVAFDGASTSYKSELRGIVPGDPDTLAARELTILQLRSAHAVRNNSIAQSALKKYVTAIGSLRVHWVDAKENEHKQMQDLWDVFAENPSLDGHGTFDNVQSVWHSSMFIYGSAFSRMHIRRSDNPAVIPLKLQGIPADYLDISYMGDTLIKKGQTTKYGITFQDTKPLMYHFKNPETDLRTTVYQPRIDIPAEEIVHLFIRETPGQWLGTPFITSVLLGLYELEELTDATIAKQKAAQVISWIVENTNPMNPIAVGMPGYVNNAEGEQTKLVFKSAGTNVQYLNKGEKISFHQSADIGDGLETLIKNELSRIASAVGIPYYQLTGDTAGLDFSSIRAVLIEFRKRLEYIQHFYIIPLGMTPITLYFKQLVGLYKRKITNAFPLYQMPRWYGVDDLKDAQADVLEVQSGMATLQSKLDERHTTYEKIAADRQKIQELGLYHLLTPNGGGQSTGQLNNVNPNTNTTGS